MSESDLRFVIFRDVNDGYRWRLRSASGQRRYSDPSEDTGARTPAYRKYSA